MRIAVEGCAHGELNKIYECIKHIETEENLKVDLLICCGDFQSVRDNTDMKSMAVPQKYMEMKDFHEYYTGKRVAPIVTIFIGGNHEASSYLWELPYGGWVAENIYYLGYAGVVNFAGIRIAGMSGIFKQRDYFKDHYESPPFSEDSKRSFYHTRKQDVEKLKLLKGDPPDIVLSHDWPTNIYHHGNKEQLIRFKPFLKDEIENSTLGNEGAEELLKHLQPDYWFSGHMHAKFAALVEHNTGRKTKFLALDKCLPKRKFLQVIDFGQAKCEPVLKYDRYWLSVLRVTGNSDFRTISTDALKSAIVKDIENSNHDLDIIPFSKCTDGQNKQTIVFCERLNLPNPCSGQQGTVTWKSIKKDVMIKKDVITTEEEETTKDPVEPHTPPKTKMQLPLPGTGDTTLKKQNKSVLSRKRDDEDDFEDDFGEISNPNFSSNLDDIDLDSSSSSSSNSNSDSSSDNDSSDNDSSDGEDKKTKQKKLLKKPDKKVISKPDPEDSDPEDSDPEVSIKEDSNEKDFPSFIETPMFYRNVKSHTPSGETPVSSTPFKWKVERNDMKNKALSFTETPLKHRVSVPGNEKTYEKITTVVEERPFTGIADYQGKGLGNNDQNNVDLPSQTSSDKTDTDASLTETDSTTPKKKFKLIRRNQSIYTPTKEEDE